MVGTSYAMGLRVPREKTFAALLPLELSQRTGRKVDLYNEAMIYQLPDSLALHFNNVLAARPDMILWALTSYDVERTSDRKPRPLDPNVAKSLGWRGRAWRRIKTAFKGKSFIDALADIFHGTRTKTLLCQFLYASPSQYVKSYLILDDKEMGFLKTEPSAEWQRRLKNFDSDAAEIEAQAKEADVPFVAVLLPDHVQAAMISMGDWPAGFDPYRLDEELRSIVTSHDGIYISLLSDLRDVPTPELGYFPIENHPNNYGNLMFSKLLGKELTNGAVPALSIATPEAALTQNR